MTIKEEIQDLLDKGIYDQHILFSLLYSKHHIHYSVLRRLVSEVKNARTTP